MRNEGVFTHLVLVRLESFLFNSFDSLSELLFRGNGVCFRIGEESEEHAVILGNHGGEHLIELLEWEELSHLVVDSFLGFDAGSGDVVDEELHILFGVRVVLAVVALVVLLLYAREEFGACTFVFTNGESGAGGTEQLAVSLSESGHHIGILGIYREGESTLGL